MNLYPLLVPAGSDTELQYNNGNLFGGDSSLTWDDGAAKALTIGNCAVLGSDSAVFQPNSDSTTFFQVKDADGGTSVLSVSTASAQHVGIGIDEALAELHIYRATGNTEIRLETTTDNDPTIEYWEDSVRVGNLRFDTSANDYLITNFVNSSTADIKFRTQGTRDSLSIRGSGNVGISEAAPETLLELTGPNPYITLHNSTHEDSDGGGESRIIGKREDGAGTETAAGQIEICHDGVVANDQLGRIVEYVNTGAGLVEARRIDSDGTFTTVFGRKVNVTRYTANQTLDAQDHHVFGDTDGGAFTITLPAGVAGTEYRIVNTGSSANNLTITPDGAELLMGANANWTLLDGEALLIVYESTEGWW